MKLTNAKDIKVVDETDLVLEQLESMIAKHALHAESHVDIYYNFSNTYLYLALLKNPHVKSELLKAGYSVEHDEGYTPAAGIGCPKSYRISWRS